MKPETKINLLIWCGYMLGVVYASFLDFIPGGWKWLCWVVMIVVLVMLMLLSDRVMEEAFDRGMDHVLDLMRNFERQGKQAEDVDGR